MARKTEAFNELREMVDELQGEISRTVVGYERTRHRFLVCLGAGGHLLLQGVPGIAKTTLARKVAASLDLEFRRWRQRHLPLQAGRQRS